MPFMPRTRIQPRKSARKAVSKKVEIVAHMESTSSIEISLPNGVEQDLSATIAITAPKNKNVATAQEDNAIGKISLSSHAPIPSFSSNITACSIGVSTSIVSTLSNTSNIPVPAASVLGINDNSNKYHQQGQKRCLIDTSVDKTSSIQADQNCDKSSTNDSDTENKRQKIVDDGKGEKNACDGNSGNDGNVDSTFSITLTHPPMYHEFKVEDRIFCRWPKNELWYWGVVLSKFRKHESHFFRYEVQFDDGDIIKGISAKYITSKERYCDIFKGPSKAPSICKWLSSPSKTKNEEKSITSILHEVREEDLINSCNTNQLYLLRCERCEQCLKPECQRCASCKQNKKKIKKKCPERLLECCLKKMCCEIPDIYKAQKAEGLPNGYSFIFYPERKNPPRAGLAIFARNGEMFKSVDLLIRNSNVFSADCRLSSIHGNSNLESQFYSFVGLSLPSLLATNNNVIKNIGCSASNYIVTKSLVKERSNVLADVNIHPLHSNPSLNINIKLPSAEKNVSNDNGEASFKATKTKDCSKNKRLTTIELFTNRCQHCVNCKKPDCGLCFTCLNNLRRKDSDPNIECCLQKLCITICQENKQQKAWPIFPKGWYFYFDLSKKIHRPALSKYLGLFLVSPSGRLYRSVEAAISHTPKGLGSRVNLAEKFYNFVGLHFSNDADMKNGLLSSSSQNRDSIGKSNNTEANETANSIKTKMEQEWMTNEKGLKSYRNGKKSSKYSDINRYPNEKAAGARVYGKFSNGQWYWGCILSIRGSGANTKYSVLFDDGDFLTVPASDLSTQREYVRIFKLEPPPKPGDKKAKSYDLKPCISDNDCTNKILDVTDSATTALSSSITRDKMKKKSEKNKHRVITDPRLSNALTAVSYTPKELYTFRCKACALCLQPNCERCTCCIRNASSTRDYREVCLQKMCRNISIDAKAQPAVGFPEGWKFYFGDSKDFTYNFRVAQQAQHSFLHGLVLLSPCGRKYTSPDKASVHYNRVFTSPESIKREFYDHVGIDSAIVDIAHGSAENVLIGHGFCHEWTNVNGQKMVLFGEVTRCEIEYGVRRYMIDYEEESRQLVNLVSTGCDIFVPKQEKYMDTMAWGGCIRYEGIVSHKNYGKQKTSNATAFEILSAAGKLPFYFSWVVPEMRIEDHEVISIDKKPCRVPKVTLVVKGYKLIFSVRTSRIPNAGFGVFVRCISLKRGNENRKQERIPPQKFNSSCTDENLFTLNAGELIDIGVYAPFRKEDRKEEHIFLLKNFIYSLNCEEWCFDTRHECQMFDITDDLTGEIHNLARDHLPAYVNETDGVQFSTIRAEFDPEGAVHYLLGHAEESYGKLQLPADGVTETELFIDYGSRYENVRIRKGYSRLSKDQQEVAMQRCAKDEAEYVLEIKDYSATEIDEGIRFLNKHFLPPDTGKGGDNNCEKISEKHACKSSIEVDNNTSEAHLTTENNNKINDECPTNSTITSSLIVRERALIIALCLKIRAKSIQEEFKNVNSKKAPKDRNGIHDGSCDEKNSKMSTGEKNQDEVCDNGVSNLDTKQIINSANQLIIYLGSFYDSDDKMKESLLSNEFFVQLLETMAPSKKCKKIKLNENNNDPTSHIAKNSATNVNINTEENKLCSDNHGNSANCNISSSNGYVQNENNSNSIEDRGNINEESSRTANYINTNGVSGIDNNLGVDPKCSTVNSNNIMHVSIEIEKDNIRDWSTQEFREFIFKK